VSRTTRTNFESAYRVVLVHGYGTEYKGPYQTLSAAKGQLTAETGGRWQTSTTGYIEIMTGNWRKVED